MAPRASTLPRGGMAARSRHQSRRRVLLGAGRRRAACWPRSSRARSSTSPRCSASASSKGTAAYAVAKAGVDPAHQGARRSNSPSRACGSTPSRRAGSSPSSTATFCSASTARRSSARSRWAASARTAISTARCCCSRPTPAAYITGATIVVDGGQVVAHARRTSVTRNDHGLHAFARDRRYPPAHARLRREHVLPLEADPANYDEHENIRLDVLARCAGEGEARPACGRRRRRRNTAAWRCRSSAGRRCTRRRTARSSGRSRSTAWRPTTAT